MPEYLTPGVYLEETSFRARSIEGVATATFGMAGLTRYGPVPYLATTPTNNEVPMVPDPVLVTSFTEFQRAFGGLGPVGTGGDTRNYLAYAARAFFGNGGRRLYVARVFPFTRDANDAIDVGANFAALPVPQGAAQPIATWRARWPGAAANEFSVQVGLVRSKNVLIPQAAPAGGSPQPPRLTGVQPGAAVEIFADLAALTAATKNNTAPVGANIRIIAENNNVLGYRNSTGGVDAPTSGSIVSHITLQVTVRWGSRSDVYTGLELDDAHPRAIHKVLQAVDPTDEFSLVWLDVPKSPNAPTPSALLGAFLSFGSGRPFLTGGVERQLTADLIKGEAADPDDPRIAATGLFALAEQEDVAIVASPNAISFATPGEITTATNDLIAHCEAPKAYRIGIVDPPPNQSISDVRQFRAQFDSNYAALYYPWVQIIDPTAPVDPLAGPALIDLPPSGFTAGIYARSDVQRGVHKAPANEVVLGITKFLLNVTYDRQSVLNPEGINALRFFEGRANRVWGARTMSSDPEWKYVNVRRLFNYLEHSIDRSTQWAVFEPNNERLWANIRQSIEDFLLVVWQSGALMGTKPEQAFFVRCDRTTMTQNDLDNGRLICLIGVAPTYPAEFVIFRIGQWTADTPQN
jgi:phage tail sheath protein FI